MSEREQTGLPAEEFADVMSGIDKAAPLLRTLSGRGGEGDADTSPHHALVCALKPYLSPTRCEAADYLLRLWRIGRLIKNITKGE